MSQTETKPQVVCWCCGLPVVAYCEPDGTPIAYNCYACDTRWSRAPHCLAINTDPEAMRGKYIDHGAVHVPAP